MSFSEPYDHVSLGFGVADSVNKAAAGYVVTLELIEQHAFVIFDTGFLGHCGSCEWQDNRNQDV
jgi:hypothetical protein